MTDLFIHFTPPKYILYQYEAAEPAQFGNYGAIHDRITFDTFTESTTSTYVDFTPLARLHYFCLDAEDQFAPFLFAIYFRTAPIIVPDFVTTTTAPVQRHESESNVVVSSIGRSSTMMSSSLPELLQPRFRFSHLLSQGLERIYRSMFETPPPRTKSTPTFAHLTHQHTTHLISPSPLIVSATISCLHNPPPAQIPSKTIASSFDYDKKPTAFTFSFMSFRLDMGRLAVGLEEGLQNGDDRVVMWLRR